MLLKNKTAVIFGAGGGIGAAVARAFAREGASVYLSGRHQTKVDPVAKKIQVSGGHAEAAQVNALDERAVDEYLDSVAAKAGAIDIMFNAVGIPNTTLQGVPLVDLAADQFLLPIETYARAYFLTARLAARRMIKKRAGVIMTATAVPSRAGIPLLGGFAPSQAAVEALTRGLSAELSSKGIRVVGLRPDGMPDSATIKEVFGIQAKAWGMTWDQFHDLIAAKNHRQRLLSLDELANMAALMASDRASAITGSTVNLSVGMLAD